MAGVSGTNRLPKDAQVIVSMLKEAGINEYEPRVVNQLLEFTYRYVTGILDDARIYAQHAKKKTIDLDDCKLASMMQLERSFTSPPPRDMLMEVAKSRNSSALPVIKPHYGLRLPPDRHCLSACNYKLKSNKKPVGNKGQSMHVGSSLLSSGSRMGAIGRGSNLNMKMTPGVGGNMAMMSSMQSASQPIRTKVMSAPKPVIKFNTTPVGGGSSSALPKIQIAGSSMPSSNPTASLHTSVTQASIDVNALKRKREPDDSFEAVE